MTPKEFDHFMLYTRRREDGCLEWTAGRSEGYGVFWAWKYDGSVKRQQFAHRLIYEHFKGMIPQGMTVDHTCHNGTNCPGGKQCPHRRCVDFTHLELVTRGENVLRGKTLAHANMLKTHCVNGHEFTPENTIVRLNGKRQCRTCDNARDRARWSQKRLSDPRLAMNRTHCKAGHELSGDNVLLCKNGTRKCRICDAVRLSQRARTASGTLA
jgi:HNH endonuclease